MPTSIELFYGGQDRLLTQCLSPGEISSFSDDRDGSQLEIVCHPNDEWSEVHTLKGDEWELLAILRADEFNQSLGYQGRIGRLSVKHSAAVTLLTA